LKALTLSTAPGNLFKQTAEAIFNKL